MDIPSPDELVQLKGQQTLSTDPRVEKWTLDVYAVNDRRAKARARKWARKEVPFAVNFIQPDTTEETEQSKLREFIADSVELDLEFREVELTVVMRD